MKHKIVQTSEKVRLLKRIPGLKGLEMHYGGALIDCLGIASWSVTTRKYTEQWGILGALGGTVVEKLLLERLPKRDAILLRYLQTQSSSLCLTRLTAGIVRMTCGCEPDAQYLCDGLYQNEVAATSCHLARRSSISCWARWTEDNRWPFTGSGIWLRTTLSTASLIMHTCRDRLQTICTTLAHTKWLAT